jgi:branched-chain amino acid transport system permease protein
MPKAPNLIERFRELEKRRPGEKTDTRIRAVRMGVFGVLGMILLAAFGALNVEAVLFLIVIAIIAVPPWETVPHVGRYLRGAMAFAIAATYPFFWNHLFTIPVFGSFPSIATAVVMLVFIQMAVGLNIVVGYAGLLDLGYVAFYAMGAYIAAWFASVQFSHRNVHFLSVGVGSNVPGFHISIWILLVVAGIATAFVGVLIGLPTLRLRGDYLAIVTLGFGEILPQIARNGDNLFGFNLTNGPNGITPIDSPGFFGVNYLTGSGTFWSSARLFYWTGLVLLLITVFCSLRLRDSRLGRAWIAIREDETAAAAMGVPLMRTKTWAYATGAFFGGVAGAYFASFRSAVFPGDFFFNISVEILCMVIIGGMGNIWGVIVGASFLAYLDQEGLADSGGWFNSHFSEAGFNRLVGVLFLVALVAVWMLAKDIAWKAGLLIFCGFFALVFFVLTPVSLPLDVPKFEFGIFGIILLLTMLFRPEGLIPSTRRAAEFHEGVHDQPLYDVVHE